MQKIFTLLLLVLTAVCLIGCSGRKAGEENSVLLNKDGSVTSVIYEEFGKEYYNQEKLQNYMQAEVDKYNKENPDAITVVKFESVDGYAKAQLNFKSGDDFAVFTHKRFFYGSIKEAYDSDIDLDVMLFDVNDEGNTISRSELLEMGDKKILIFALPIKIRSNDKITYASDNIKILSDKEAVTMGDELSYLVFN